VLNGPGNNEWNMRGQCITKKRRPWVAVARGLEQLEYADTVSGRGRHLEWLEGCVDWTVMKKGDWSRGLVAGLIRRRSLIDNGWLEMGARSAVSRIMRQADERM